MVSFLWKSKGMPELANSMESNLRGSDIFIVVNCPKLRVLVLSIFCMDTVTGLSCYSRASNHSRSHYTYGKDLEQTFTAQFSWSTKESKAHDVSFCMQ